MFKFIKSHKYIDTKQAVNIIENYIYAELKPLGFKKFGRTLHRFVSNDISQIINFQTGLPKHNLQNYLCVNTGIRIPECEEINCEDEENKKYYKEYECTIRSSLGEIKNKKQTWYDLSKNPQKTAEKILKEIKRYVIPAFDILNSREAILAHRREYPQFDTIGNNLALLHESIIYNRLGAKETARKKFNEYYNNALAVYEHDKKYGKKIFLKKGQIIISGGQKITSDKTGYKTLFDADDAHLKYLDQLKEKLEL